MYYEKHMTQYKDNKDYDIHQLIGLVWVVNYIQLCCKDITTELYIMTIVYQIHHTIDNESRFSLFIGQQSNKCDIRT